MVMLGMTVYDNYGNYFSLITSNFFSVSERGSLTICILRARNLMALDMNGKMISSCFVYMLALIEAGLSGV